MKLKNIASAIEVGTVDGTSLAAAQQQQQLQQQTQSSFVATVAAQGHGPGRESGWTASVEARARGQNGQTI